MEKRNIIIGGHTLNAVPVEDIEDLLIRFDMSNAVPYSSGNEFESLIRKPCICNRYRDLGDPLGCSNCPFNVRHRVGCLRLLRSVLSKTEYADLYLTRDAVYIKGRSDSDAVGKVHAILSNIMEEFYAR